MKNAGERTKEMLEFQSDATELEQSKPPVPARLALYLILAFLLAALLWACLFKVDEIVVAPGKFIASSNNIVMKPLEKVVVKKVEVEVGQLVKAGDPLITFDETFNQSNVNRLAEQLGSVEAEFKRLQAEYYGQDFTLDSAAIGKDAQWQLAIFAKRSRFCKEKLEYFNENAKRLEAAQETIRSSLVKQQERLDTLRRLEKMFDGLHDRQVASLKELVEIQISRLQMESEVDNQRKRLVEIEHEVLSGNAERNSFIEEWQKNIVEEMVKVRRSFNDTREELEKAKRLNTLGCLRAPVAAIVLEIAQLSNGSAVREAEALITLVPLNGSIEAEVNILPQDIGKVKLGDEVRVKLDAFPFQQHGVLDGKLRMVSGDTFQDQQPGSGAKQSFYHGRVVVSGKLKNAGPNFRIIPGMQITAEIKVGKRRVISYLLNPLVKSLDEAAREP